MEKIKVFLLDDHRIVRNGIRALLESDNSFEVIGEAENYSEFSILMEYKTPDIVIMDISLPDMSGIEITKIISETYPNIKVLILSMYKDEDFVLQSIKNGAKGYLAKNTTKKELCEALHEIYHSKEYFSEEINRIILKSYINKIREEDSDTDLSEKSLTPREMEILKLFGEGMANKEIADKLFISIRTVESHKNHIMSKFELKSNVDLVKLALKYNLIRI